MKRTAVAILRARVLRDTGRCMKGPIAMTNESRYEIARQFTEGFAAALKPERRRLAESDHWIAGWDAGDKAKRIKLSEWNKYLVGIGYATGKLDDKEADPDAYRSYCMVEMQRHRDAWRSYAYGRGDRPEDFLDGTMAPVDRGPTLIETLREELEATKDNMAYQAACMTLERAANKALIDLWRTKVVAAIKAVDQIDEELQCLLGRTPGDEGIEAMREDAQDALAIIARWKQLV